MKCLCGIIHNSDPYTTDPSDPNGCLLEHAHDGPHEFLSGDGRRYQWETDLCDTCDCEGDYCTTYWRVAEAQRV
jgi:hypothetical protein